MKDYYRVLGVPRDADDSAIKAAYRRLAKRYHPDVNPGKEAKARFLEINEAYETLSDPVKRAQYDNSSAKTPAFSGEKQPDRTSGTVRPVTMEDVQGTFENFFGFNPKTKDSMKKPQSNASQMDTTDLFEAFMRKRK